MEYITQLVFRPIIWFFSLVVIFLTFNELYGASSDFFLGKREFFLPKNYPYGKAIFMTFGSSFFGMAAGFISGMWMGYYSLIKKVKLIPGILQWTIISSYYIFKTVTETGPEYYVKPGIVFILINIGFIYLSGIIGVIFTVKVFIEDEDDS